MSSTSIAPFPIPMQPPPMTAGEKDMRRDPAFPDAADSDVLSLLGGPVQAMREQAQWLLSCLARHREIDRDLWQDLSDLAGDVLNQTDLVICVACLKDEQVKLGRGRGFDAVLCDQHLDDLMERER
jgi:hypothetical protein